MRWTHTAAARAVFVSFAALGLATLLNANGLRKTAETQSQGIRRDVSIAVMRPIVAISRRLYLTEPRRAVQAAIGRTNEDEIDTTVHLSLPAQPPRRAAPAPSRPPHVTPSAGRVPAPRPGTVPSHDRALPEARAEPPAPKKRAGPAVPLFTRGHPLQVWVAGDSLAEVPGLALERAVGDNSAIEVTGIESRLSTGLGRPDLYNWFTRFQQELRQRPNVALLSFGADDAHDYMTGVPPGRTIGPLGSPSWIREYRRRVDGVTREFNRAGVYVVWLGAPIPRGPGFARGFRVVDSVLRSVVDDHPRTSAYVDTWHMFATRHGRYADYLRQRDGQLVRMRADDGVHYEPAGGDLIADHLLARLAAVFHLTPVSGTTSDRKRRASPIAPSALR
jgi:hypothetical protein